MTASLYSGEVEYATAADHDGPCGGQFATHYLLESGFKPTAIIAANDFIVLGVLK